MDVVDADGRSVRGEVGELVCRKPFPGMTRGFCATRSATSTRTGGGCPGSGCTETGPRWTRTATGSCTAALTTRSNIAGKRIGPAEIESAAVGHAACVRGGGGRRPAPGQGRGRVDLRVLVPGAEASEELAGEVSAAVAEELGKAFRPDRVLFVPALPKTRSAKIVRRAVRARALGKDPGDLSSVENPEALDEIGRVSART